MGSRMYPAYGNEVLSRCSNFLKEKFRCVLLSQISVERISL